MATFCNLKTTTPSWSNSSSDSKAGYTAEGYSILEYARARYGHRRSQTWGTDGSPLFVVHQENDGSVVLGIAYAWLDASHSETLAKILATDNLRQLRLIIPRDWQSVTGNIHSLWNIDINGRRWFLRRHSDVWILLKAETGTPRASGPEILHWAGGQIRARYEVELDPWQIGPDTGAANTAAYYAEGGPEITPKDRSEAIRRMIAGMY